MHHYMIRDLRNGATDHHRLVRLLYLTRRLSRPTRLLWVYLAVVRTRT
jgi:hypothetical protein